MKFTPATIQKLATAIRQGATYELACKYAGISDVSFYLWRKRGREEIERREGKGVKPGTAIWNKEQPFVDFVEEIAQAEGDAAIGWLAMIQQAATEGNWQAAAWKLERRYPHEYGRRTVDTNVGGKLQIEVVEVDADDDDE